MVCQTMETLLACRHETATPLSTEDKEEYGRRTQWSESHS
jgi:hypothetical protein